MNKRVKSNAIRIIGGQWRGRKFPVLDAPGLRPTTDRVRETLFNWLMYQVPGARCLDLFAGTGVLGLEALSRGASYVQFVESESKVASLIKQNLALLKVASEHAAVSNMPAARFLMNPPTKPYNLVFLDPPFADEHLPSIIERLSQRGFLASEAHVYIEQSAQQGFVGVPDAWQVHREGRAGQSQYRLYVIQAS